MFVHRGVEKTTSSQVAPAKKTQQKETECPVEQGDPNRTNAKIPSPSSEVSFDGSSHSSSSSVNSRKRSKGMKGSASALGLDKMIDEKRDAKSMSERVVHIEVRTSSIHFVGIPLLEHVFTFIILLPCRSLLENQSKKFTLAFTMDPCWGLVFLVLSV